MPERVRVEYSRKISAQANGEYNTEQLGAGWEFEVDDGADFQDEYARGFAVVKLTVDTLFASLKDETRPEPTHRDRPVARPITLPGESLARDREEKKESPKGNGEVVEGQEYEFINARVWNVEEATTRQGKRYAKVRIGDKQQIPGTGYASVKSYNPYMISKLLALREGDHVDIRGTFEGWDGNNGRMYDFNPVDVERVRDVRAD